MNKNIDFQWDLTEENFRKMMAVDSGDVYGDVRFGDMLVEFRYSYDGEEKSVVSDMFLFGEHDIADGVQEYMANDQPYFMLDEDMPIPSRRTLDSFKKRFEAIVFEKLGDEDSSINDKYVCTTTRTHDEWYPDSKNKYVPQGPYKIVASVPTILGDLVVMDVHDPEYPGFRIGVKRPGEIFDPVWVEVCNETKTLQAHVYSSDKYIDEPVYDGYFSEDEINKYIGNE